MHISQMQKKIQKKFFVYEIMAFEIVAVNFHIDAGILVIGS